jgi:hypothetical protein
MKDLFNILRTPVATPQGTTITLLSDEGNALRYASGYIIIGMKLLKQLRGA